MTSSLIPVDQRRARARKIFFEHGQVPTGLIDDAIVHSWQRCSAARKCVSEQVQFDNVSRIDLLELLDDKRLLLAAATQPLEYLSQTVSGAGYSVLLTDDKGIVLEARRSERCDHALVKGAFRQGANLSEANIGTSAMSCAIVGRRPLLVSGTEHYFEENHIFNCAAAPIVDPMGRVLGAINITHNNPLEPGTTLALVQQYSARVERQLMEMLSPYLMVSLAWEANGNDKSGSLLVALGQEGQVLGLSPCVRGLIGLASSDWLPHFEDLFDLRFEDMMNSFQHRRQPVMAKMLSGMAFSLSPVDTGHYKNAKRMPRGSAMTYPQSNVDFGDPSMHSQIDVAARAMSKGLPVLLLGETGTGKEVVATTLHNTSMLSSGKLVAINCAAIPDTLIEGELFGHAEGAFTGARRGGAPGKIEQANGGTLFLDEIGDMPLALQSRLLRVLENREVTRLGSATSKKVHFQLICATHRDLSDAVHMGEFRADLLYRIKGMTIRLSRLAERPGLKDFIVNQCQILTHGSRELSEDCLAILTCYSWPGNVRELLYALTHADAVAEPGVILEPRHLPDEITVSSVVETPNHSAADGKSLKTMERILINEALALEGGDVNRASKRLGIGRATLYRKIKATDTDR